MSEVKREEFDAFRAETKAEFADSRAVNRRIVATLVRLEGKVDDLAERMATKDDLAALEGKLTSGIDGLAGRIDDMNFKWAKHEARISDIEKPGS